MKKTVMENINPPYSLHDMNIISFEILGDDLILRSQTGIIPTHPPYEAVDGHVVLCGVDFDFSFAYVMDFQGNAGSFTAHKMFLSDFIEKFNPLGFTVISENFGYNMVTYGGFLSSKEFSMCECIIIISHTGDTVFIEDDITV